ncbi:MAG: hypothetical protein IPG29_06855 [Sphingobacteriales bacterium]|nr:hypothetical protein [Sphingobacteriales bacterium]
MQIGGGFKHPPGSLSASQYILNNYIIWNGQGHPQQLSGKTISITQLMGNINLHWRKLHFENTIVGQFYPKQILPVLKICQNGFLAIIFTSKLGF